MRMELKIALSLWIVCIIISGSGASSLKRDELSFTSKTDATSNVETGLSAGPNNYEELTIGDLRLAKRQLYEEKRGLIKNGGRNQESFANETSLNEDQVFIRFGGVQIVNEPAAPAKPTETTKVAEIFSSTKPKTKQNLVQNIALPLMLILANVAILFLLGLLAYILGRAVTMNRRAAKRNRHNCDETMNESLGLVSFPTATVRLSETPSGNCEDSCPKRLVSDSSFCQEKSCRFMKDVKRSNRHLFSKRSKKHHQDLKASLFQPVVYDTSSLTCDASFNNSTPLPLGLPSTSSPEVLDVNRNPVSTSSSQAIVLD